MVGHRGDGRGAQAHVRLAHRHRRQRLRLRHRRRAGPGGPGRPLQHDAGRGRGPGHLLDPGAPGRRTRASREGDMFLCNDPWVGGGLHQNDAVVYQPIFHEGKLFAWTSAICHEPDLGGVGLGSFSPAAQDVFSESVPTPPVKVVRDFQLQRDVADLWVRRSRVPMLVGLDLRAQVGANNVGRERLLAVIAKYGADTVKAVMKRMMDDAEHRLRGKLSSLPDGTWNATGYQDQSHEGDREPAQDHPGHDQARGPPDLRLHRHRPAGGRDQLHLRRAARRGHAGPAAHPGRRHPLVGRRPDALLRPHRRRRHDQQRDVPRGGQPGAHRPGLADRHPGRRVPVADARPLRRPRPERPGRPAAAPGTPRSSPASTSAAPSPCRS